MNMVNSGVLKNITQNICLVFYLPKPVKDFSHGMVLNYFQANHVCHVVNYHYHGIPIHGILSNLFSTNLNILHSFS